jgi:hypothetical protein
MSTQSAPTVPHYEILVAELIERHGAEMKPGGVYRVEVAHDTDCPALAGSGPCDCQGVASLVEVADRLGPSNDKHPDQN